jgi:phosphonate transport system substrate-binding protein
VKHAASVLLVILMMALSGCGGPQEKVIRLQGQDSQKAAPSENYQGRLPFRVAVSSILSPVETLDGYEPLLKYLESRLDRPVVLLQRRTYQEVNRLLADKGVDLAFVCSGGYIAGRGIELLAVPEVKGMKIYQSYIIARTTLPAQSLKELRGGSFAFTDPLSFSGYMAPLYMLLSEHADPKTYFSRTFFTFSHDNSIRSVVDGIVDGAAVDSMIYDRVLARHPEWAGRVRVVEKSLTVGNPPVVVPQGLDTALRQKVAAILFSMQDDPAGKKALQRLDYDRFTVPDEALYKPLEPIWQAVREQL